MFFNQETIFFSMISLFYTDHKYKDAVMLKDTSHHMVDNFPDVHRLRPKSAEACITGASFFKFSLPVPQELQVSCLPSCIWSKYNFSSLYHFVYLKEFCADEKALEIHNDFMKAVDAVHIKYCPEKVSDAMMSNPVIPPD